MKKSLYCCIDCKYETNDKSNYVKHCRTKKHVEKVEQSTKTKQKTKKYVKKNYLKCQYCKKIFSTKSNKTKHINIYHIEKDKVQLSNRNKNNEIIMGYLSNISEVIVQIMSVQWIFFLRQKFCCNRGILRRPSRLRSKSWIYLRMSLLLKM